MSLTPHSPAWYDRLATMQKGYYYPWKSHLPIFNGEDVFLTLLREHLAPDKSVLEVGCGHGELALQIAEHCQALVAYDRVPAYIDQAKAAAEEQYIRNVEFICADSLEAANGQVRLPVDDQTFDIIYSRRGPLHWIEDAHRVVRTGTILLQLNPSPPAPPEWNGHLPEQVRLPESLIPTMEQRVRQRLQQQHLHLHSCWTFEVHELFTTPEDLFMFITWGHDPGEVAKLAQLMAIVDMIFREYAIPTGIEIPFGRFLWKAVI
jgi:SAM-dependent methyltransferase